MALITLTTDFGLQDPDLGYLKSQILQAVPQARLIDISHTGMPFDPEEAIYILKNALFDFPLKTIHLIGLDSETYKEQTAILVDNGKHYFLGNDTGIIPAVLAGQNFKVYRLPLVQNDIFLQTHIKTVQKLTANVQPEDFALITENYKEIKLSKPLLRYDEKTRKVALITVKVIYNDNYGNAVFNITKEEFEKARNGRSFSIRLHHYEIKNIQNNYHPLPKEGVITSAGTMFARFNHFGYLEIYIYKSNRQTGGANTLLGLQKNQIVNIVFD